VRFLGYFLAVFVALFVLRQLPLVGGLFRVPLFGFFLAAILVSAVVAKGGAWWSAQRRLASQTRELGQVDTPQMRGKLGRLLLLNGRPAQALAPLGEAVDWEPENPEWHYRLGQARLRTGDRTGGVEALAHAAELDERHAYGEVLLLLGEARLGAGQAEQALVSLERFEALQGPSPRSAYWRGRALAALGRKEEARASYADVSRLVAQAPKYQRGTALGFQLRATLARLF